MKIYVGRWDLLPLEWEGIYGLYEKPEEEIQNEVDRQLDLDTGDPHIGWYFPNVFEEEFNGDDYAELHGTTYWIKIF
jgi:hypothetical protein